jgi:hypothetical protein
MVAAGLPGQLDTRSFTASHMMLSFAFTMHPSGPNGCCDGNHRFEFQKRRQFFVRMYNVTLPVVAIRISNEDSSPASIVTVDCETLLLCWGGRGFRDC